MNENSKCADWNKRWLWLKIQWWLPGSKSSWEKVDMVILVRLRLVSLFSLRICWKVLRHFNLRSSIWLISVGCSAASPSALPTGAIESVVDGCGTSFSLCSSGAACSSAKRETERDSAGVNCESWATTVRSAGTSAGPSAGCSVRPSVGGSAAVRLEIGLGQIESSSVHGGTLSEEVG